ncbi:hypothetical protein CRYUN_Cryun24cG0038300 [Craigia yunnanensis]
MLNCFWSPFLFPFSFIVVGVTDAIIHFHNNMLQALCPFYSTPRFDYEDDLLENNFNILLMLVEIYRPSTAPTMLAKYITVAGESQKGGKASGHPLGTWSIPPVIANEDLY